MCVLCKSVFTITWGGFWRGIPRLSPGAKIGRGCVHSKTINIACWSYLVDIYNVMYKPLSLCVYLLIIF